MIARLIILAVAATLALASCGNLQSPFQSPCPACPVPVACPSPAAK